MSMTAQRTRRTFLFVMGICAVVSAIAVVYPVYVIRPFRAQGARELAIALVVSRFRPVVTMIVAATALAALVGYWRAQPKRWRRVPAVLGAGIVCLFAALARVNIYELMFHPDDRPSFAAAPQVKLDGDEKVIAVKIGSAARAYPIRSISYHHVINDVLDQTGIVATY